MNTYPAWRLEITLCATCEHSSTAHAMPGHPDYRKSRGMPNCSHGDLMGNCRCHEFVAGPCVWMSTDKRRAVRLAPGEVPKGAAV